MILNTIFNIKLKDKDWQENYTGIKLLLQYLTLIKNKVNS